METVIITGTFLAIILLLSGGYAVYSSFRTSETRTVIKRLRTLSAEGSVKQQVDILQKRYLSEIPWFNRLLLLMTRQHNFDRLLEQANISLPLGFFVLLTLVLFAAGFMLGSFLKIALLLRIIFSLLFSMMPYFYLVSRKQKRVEKFQAQLPDALDMISRSMKAGHAFAGGMKMLSEEFDDPVGTEFRKTVDEINFGVNFNDAMKNLANRIDCPDLQFFVVSVIIQKETGGNLAELLEKIAYLIRERYKLHGKIRAFAAEGKLSAVILSLLPAALALYFFIVNPKYISVLFTDRIGIIMALTAIILMITGVFVIKKMISIRI